ncbi:MAG: MCP four helix bundle domain-containing protein [Bacteroidales bacterium]|nr:MCP four helix bundle domain-containing protein [Bacteroidales bacterium]
MKLKNIFKEPLRLSLRLKIILSLSAIAVILLISSIISVLEYKSMSTYVSSLIADNIHSINMAQELAESSNNYNLDILAVIGDENLNSLPDFDQQEFVSHCDSLKKSLSAVTKVRLADSVLYAYSAYLLTSLELPEVLKSDFIDSRTWYFDRLQPRYNRLSSAIDKMSTEIYSDLKKNSTNFDRGFYRSIVPGIVAVGVGLLLVLMLMFFILSYYVDPIYKMVDGLNNYRSYNKRYHYTFDGDDQLAELNTGISELTAENFQLRKRLMSLRNTQALKVTPAQPEEETETHAL